MISLASCKKESSDESLTKPETTSEVQKPEDLGKEIFNGKGACIAHNTAFLASASDSEAVSCNATIFVGGKIKTGWEVRMVADTMLFEMLPQTVPERFPVLRITAQAGNTVRFVPKSIEVKGPKGCDSWLNAFSI